MSECPQITRRKFLAGLGASAATVVAGGYAISVFGNRSSPTAAGTTTTAPAGTTTTTLLPGLPDRRTLVVVEMGGGNDGLSMVVPHMQDAYFDLRRDLAVSNPIDLDGEVGLHPNLAFVADRYRAGEVAIVEGVGYPDPDLSHFASMSKWWTAGAATGPGSPGWLGSYLDLTVGTENPLAGIVIGPGPNPAMLGRSSFAVSIQDTSGLRPQFPPWIDTRDDLVSMWQGFAPSSVDSPGLLGDVQRAIAGTAAASSQLNLVLGGDEIPEPGERRRGELPEYLALAAALINSELSPPVIYVHGFGDFDTHEGQASRHSDLMRELDEGLSRFFSDLGDNSDRALVMTASEFGRRAATNGSGTDHGTAAAHMVIGAAVGGGRYGVAPDLTGLDRRGNPVHTVDFRSLYGTVLDGWLAVAHPEVLGAEFETLPIWKVS